jgi:hypothetical protein
MNARHVIERWRYAVLPAAVLVVGFAVAAVLAPSLAGDVALPAHVDVSVTATSTPAPTPSPTPRVTTPAARSSPTPQSPPKVDIVQPTRPLVTSPPDDDRSSRDDGSGDR